VVDTFVIVTTVSG